MKNLKNEKGATLVLTIMIITLFLVFILALLTQVTNTTKQVTTMEKKIDAQLIADMGVTYFQRLVETNQHLLEERINENPEDDELATVVQLFIDELLEPINQPVDVDKDRTFEITFEGYSEDKKSIYFNSVGIVADADATSNGTIVINMAEQAESGVSQ